MNRPRPPNIINLIGMLLVVVALVSAGGLYYLANEYAKISETQVSVVVGISDMSFIQDNITGDIAVNLWIQAENPSSLTIEIYLIEYLVYADRSTTELISNERFIGSGSTGEKNRTVEARSTREFQISYTLRSEYTSKFIYATENEENMPWVYVKGKAHFNIVNYPEVKAITMDIYYMGRGMVQYV